jgi:hypothetical protein
MSAPSRKGPKPHTATLFLGLKDAIAARLAAGEKMTGIYPRYAADLQISYTQFTRYVNQYIRNRTTIRRKKSNARSAVATAVRPPVGTTPVVGAVPITPRPTEPRQFVFDPTAVHCKKLV